MLNRTAIKRLKYFGHFKRMETNGYPKMAMEDIVKDTDPEGSHPKDE